MNRTAQQTHSRRDFLKAAAAVIPAFAAVKTAAAAPLLAATPPMGWNSYNHFKNQIDGDAIRAQAAAMVSSGMKAVGYEYVNMDEGWAGERDAQGVIHANAKFPDMKALADYVHSLGLKLGIYSAPVKVHVRRPPRQFWPRGAGRADLRRVGHRLPEVRPLRPGGSLQQAGGNRPARGPRHDDRGLQEDGGRFAPNGPAHRLQSLPIRHGSRVGVGPVRGRKPLAHHQ